MWRYLVVAAMCVAAVSCGGKPVNQLAGLSEEFVKTSLAFSPASATQAGLHEYAGQRLDEMLDDFGSAALERQRKFYVDFRKRLGAIDAEKLDPQDRADYAILRDQTELALLELNEIQSALHNPALYVETIGNAVFTPYMLEYATKPGRMRHIIARLEKIPLLCDQASTNLVSAPAEWTRVAMEENEGNINLVDKTIRAAVPAELAAQYERAATPALAAMRKFQTYLEKSLLPRNNYSWRLGKDRYARKFEYTLDAGMQPDAILGAADQDLDKLRARMLELALPIHKQIFPKHGAHEGEGQTNAVVSEVLDHIAASHSTPASYLDDARRDLAETRKFVAGHHLLTLPKNDNLQVIETPEYVRGIYAVGGFNPAPALEPKLGAFYWVTPIPSTWPLARVESKLREYNVYSLKVLTIHEAMPGHYVQCEFANAVEPGARRLLRGVYGNGPYIEGWAVYATQMMLEAGYLDHSPEMELTFLKHQLRVLANTIIDVRLHTLDMTEDEAMTLMLDRTFQEREEATAKLQRAKLSSCQLPTYYVGWRAWNTLRDAQRAKQGASFSLSGFHDAALRQGAIPMAQLGRVLQ